MLTSKTVSDFLTETASNSPAPGGGSVSALAAALSTALTSMVCRLTIGKKKYADVQTEIEAVLLKSESLREKAAALIDEDTFAFNKVMAAFALPKDTEDQKSARTAAIQEATKGATLVPFHLMELCADAMPLIHVVVEIGRPVAGDGFRVYRPGLELQA
ncbi:MAG: cyclodeaminase/cyclohydrolase family protein, partial [Bacteroidetes bacterium]|nr:cyclodeaminase/cyclohydrolase family protein [Bacteroidota bacterium]